MPIFLLVYINLRKYLLILGWGAMCVCVGGHSLIVEVCALCVRETSLQSRPRSDALLLLALHTIRHCIPHHHCRSLVLKVILLTCFSYNQIYVFSSILNLSTAILVL